MDPDVIDIPSVIRHILSRNNSKNQTEENCS